MHMSSGLPIMKSKDLVNWQLVSYAYDILGDVGANRFGVDLTDARTGCSSAVTSSSFPRCRPKAGRQMLPCPSGPPEGRAHLVELGKRGRVPPDGDDLTDTVHLMRSSPGHGLSRFLWRTLSQVLLQVKQMKGMWGMDRATKSRHRLTPDTCECPRLTSPCRRRFPGSAQVSLRESDYSPHTRLCLADSRAVEWD